MKQKATILTFIIVVIAIILGSYINNLSDNIKLKNIVSTNESYVNNIGEKVIDTIEKSKNKVVSIIPKNKEMIYEKDPFGYYESIFKNNIGGSGIFISKDGKIITNAHIINPLEKYIVITNNGNKYNASVENIDVKKDIATLQIETNDEFEYFEIVENSDLKVGSFVVAIGNVGGNLYNSASFGIISGLNREIKIGDKIMTGLIQTDANINPGNSGGALIDLDGNLIGINSYIINGISGVGFAIDTKMIHHPSGVSF